MIDTNQQTNDVSRKGVPRIRPFRPDDAQEARQVILEGLGEHFGYIDETRNPDLEAIEKFYLDRGACFLVADVGKVVGTGCLIELRPSEGQVVRMSTAREYRRKGVGSMILKGLISEAQRRGYQTVIAATEPDWGDAVGFYRAHSFIPFDFDGTDIYMAREIEAMSIFPEVDA